MQPRCAMRHRNTWLKLLLLTASVTPASGLADLRLAPRLRRAAPHRLAPARLPAARQPRAIAIAWDPKLLAVSLGGVFAGGLHSVTGPDHLAALLPICIGKRWCDYLQCTCSVHAEYMQCTRSVHAVCAQCACRVRAVCMQCTRSA